MASRKILISVNESETSMKAVAYAGEMICGRPEFEVCLLHVVPEPPPYYYLEGHSQADYVKENEKKVASIFEDATDILVGHGIEKDKVSTRMYVTEKAQTISNAILKVQAEEAFGTVVVGKRGVSKAEEFLFGSISNAIAQSCASFSVWVVA